MNIYDNIIETIGYTPIVKLNSIVKREYANIFVKLEYFNPGGSIKDRPALGMIEDAERKGKINKETVIIEPTSGNTGIGIAMVCASKGYKCKIYMPDNMSEERRLLIRAYGAEVVLTPGEKGMKGAIEEAEEALTNNNYYMLRQFENNSNPDIHKNTTGLEILKQMNNKVDMIISGVGTGGTITGIANAIKEKRKDVQIVAVEPYSSPVMSQGKSGSHKIQGIGAGFVPEVLDLGNIDLIRKVKYIDSIDIMKKLASKEGMLLGISSGAAVSVALNEAKKIGKNKNIVVIAPDSGERYLSTGIFE